MSAFTLKSVINRMWNWKMLSAYTQACTIPTFPLEELKELEALSIKFGNCGWQEGSVYDELRESNFKIAAAIGFEWDEERNQWFEKNRGR